MALLKIIKLSEGVWKHWSDKDGFFALTRLYAKVENNKFLIVEYYGAKRRTYAISEIEVYNIGGGAETFANFDDLQIRLKALNYIGYDASFAGSSIDSTANHFKGYYNIVTNTPALSNGTGSLGDEVRCTDAGTRDFGSGNITVGVDDILAHNGIEWFLKVDNNQATDISGKQDTLTDVNFGSFINGLTSKTTPVDADYSIEMDSADGNKAKKVSWANRKATLRAYFDTIYFTFNGGIIYYKNYRNTAANITTNGVNTLLFSIPLPASIVQSGYAFEVRTISAKASGSATANPVYYLSPTSGSKTQQLGVEILQTPSNSHFTSKRTYIADSNTSVFATEFGAIVTDEQLSLNGGTGPRTLTGGNSFASNMWLDFAIINNGSGNSSNIYYAEIIVYKPI